MKLGKLKLKNAGFFSSKWSFYEYARHSLVWSMESVSTTGNSLSKDHILSEVPYIKTNNFYYQLLAAFTASYWYYLYWKQIVPEGLQTESMQELKRGRDDGLNAITTGKKKIDPYFVDLYKAMFVKYLQDGIREDCESINENSPEVFNPDIDNFTRLFIEDSKMLSLRDSKSEINETNAYNLGQLVSDIPISVFTSLSKMSLIYLPEN